VKHVLMAGRAGTVFSGVDNGKALLDDVLLSKCLFADHAAKVANESFQGVRITPEHCCETWNLRMQDLRKYLPDGR
jgi:hypothetical protein